MPRICFTATPKLPDDLKHLDFKKGDVVDLSHDQCERWIRRGVAEYVTDEGGTIVPEEMVPVLREVVENGAVLTTDGLQPAADVAPSPAPQSEAALEAEPEVQPTKRGRRGR